MVAMMALVANAAEDSSKSARKETSMELVVAEDVCVLYRFSPIPQDDELIMTRIESMLTIFSRRIRPSTS